MRNLLPMRGKEKLSQNIEEIYYRYNNMVYQVSYSYMKNVADTEDIVAEAFAKLLKSNIKFESSEHEKAWLLRITLNLCKNHLKHWWQKRVDIDNYEHLYSEDPFKTDETLKAVLDLPKRYKDTVYLYYYEGYTSKEISRMLKKPQSTICNHLCEARKILKGVLTNEG